MIRGWIGWVVVLGLALAAGGVAPAGVGAQDFEDPDEGAETCWPSEEADTDDGYPQWSEPPELVIDDSGETGYTATFETSAGNFTVELLPQEAPETVNNFVCLAWAGFYDETVFHRVVPEFVIQGGDPTATGRGGPGYRFDDEPIERDYETGTLAMANSGPDTNGSQFFVVLEGGANKLESLYTIFGQVADEASLEVVEEIGGSDPEEDPVEIETIAIEGDTADEDDPGNVVVEGDGYEGVIFSEDAALELVAALDGPSAAEDLEYWAPTEDDIEDLEDEVEAFLEEAAEDGEIGSDVVADLPEYGRQYAGIVDDGDELILANFFCDDFDIEVETEPVAVADGGDCFFKVRYDVARGEFFDLEVNGEA